MNTNFDPGQMARAQLVVNALMAVFADEETEDARVLCLNPNLAGGQIGQFLFPRYSADGGLKTGAAFYVWDGHSQGQMREIGVEGVVNLTDTVEQITAEARRVFREFKARPRPAPQEKEKANDATSTSETPTDQSGRR